MIKVTIENAELVNRMSKANNPYQVQIAWAHTHDSNGPKRYPEEITIFPKKDAQGNAIPYPKGDYTFAESSIKVRNTFPELSFPELVQLKK